MQYRVRVRSHADADRSEEHDKIIIVGHVV